MKTKYWILLFCALLAVCLGLCIPLLCPAETARSAEIISDGKSIETVSLSEDGVFVVHSPTGGENTVTVKDGKIGVTEASCPDHYCMKRGFCNSGTEIVCLPNKISIRFVGQQEIDAIVG